MQDTIVIAGGGHAAAQLVDSLRRDGYTGRLVMACGEPVIPYQRPPLSKKFLAGELEAERLPIRPASFYEHMNCETLLGNPVVSIDPRGRKVTLSDGGTLAYILAVERHSVEGPEHAGHDHLGVADDPHRHRLRQRQRTAERQDAVPGFQR